MSRFPLLRLPQLAFSGVIDAFDLSVIITASFCSRKMFRLMKIFWRKTRKLEIKLGCHRMIYADIIWNRGGIKENFRIFIRSLSETEGKSRELGKYFRGQGIMISLGAETELNFCFEDQFEGLQAVAGHVTELFSSPITKLITTDSLLPDGPRKVVDWILDKQETLEDCFIECKNMVDSENAHILSKCKFIKSFFMSTNYGKQFQHHFEYAGENIGLKNCFWFSLDNLLSLNSRYYWVESTNLSNTDLNTFLKFWIALGCDRVENAIIYMQKIDLPVLFNGIDVVRRDRNVVRIFINPENKSVSVPGGFDITRNDGVTATIVPIRDSDTCFWMVVWKK